MTTISKGFREQYRKALDSGGVIDATEAKALVNSAKTPEDKAFLARHLATDAFDGAARTAIAAKVGASKSLVGSTVGSLPGGAAVKVTRELSPPGGYRNEDQARAAARLAEVPAAVVQGPDKKW